MRRPHPERIPTYLDHMLDSIDRIQKYVAGMDEAAFRRATMVQDAVIRNFEIIGEASNRILKSDPDCEAAHPSISLSIAYGMRNALAHGYDDVVLATVWDTLRQRLPQLRDAIVAYQDQAEPQR